MVAVQTRLTYVMVFIRLEAQGFCFFFSKFEEPITSTASFELVKHGSYVGQQRLGSKQFALQDFALSQIYSRAALH